jgi:hypothetical protein
MFNLKSQTKYNDFNPKYRLNWATLKEFLENRANFAGLKYSVLTGQPVKFIRNPPLTQLATMWHI